MGGERPKAGGKKREKERKEKESRGNFKDSYLRIPLRMTLAIRWIKSLFFWYYK
jgi:hypothetical protein